MQEATSNELVSVIIPTYYRNDRLRGALKSCFQQDYRPLEVIVVDDSGESHARPIVTEYENVEYVPLSENKGAQVARDIGIQESNGRYIQLLDDDDRLLDDKLSKQVSLFRELENVGVIYCGLVWENGPKVFPDPAVRGEILEEALRFQTSPCVMGTMLIERETLEQIRPFRNRHGADDIGMKIELAQVTEFEYVNEPLLLRGNPEESLSTSMAAVDGRKQIIEMYADLYDDFPERVRRAALAETYLVEGQIRLNERSWSPSAVVAFARACYTIPGLPVPYVGSLLASLFGRRIYIVTRYAYSRYVLGKERMGKVT